MRVENGLTSEDVVWKFDKNVDLVDCRAFIVNDHMRGLDATWRVCSVCWYWCVKG